MDISSQTLRHTSHYLLNYSLWKDNLKISAWKQDNRFLVDWADDNYHKIAKEKNWAQPTTEHLVYISHTSLISESKNEWLRAH